MKTTYAIATLAACLLLQVGASSPGKAQDANRNYVMKTVHASADSSVSQPKRQTVAYYDGLGRPVQTVRKGGSPNGLDLADRIEYDSLGRESRSWQAVRSPYSNGGPVDSAVFVPAALDFYSDVAPFTEILYDGSPLDRVRKVTGPGQAWHTAEKGVTSGYLTNVDQNGDDALKCVKYGSTLSGNTGVSFGRDGLWAAGTLTVDRTEDEDGRTLWVFKDMRDLVVLERRLATAAVGNTPAIYADTYYLYDDAGRLITVLPPELSAYFSSGSWSSSTGSDPKVEGFAFQYRYDSRGRTIAKKLPGAEWTYYVYDAGDRLVLTQDGNQRARNEWSFRLQDNLGRECLTGTLTGTYDAFSSPLALEQVLAVRDRSTGTYLNHGYTVSGFTLPASAEVLTVNWWDDYTFLGREPGMDYSEYGYVTPLSSDYGDQYGTEAQGLQTGRWSKALGDLPNNWQSNPAVRETWHYDDRGRVVRHVKGYPSGARMTELSGYAFTGELTALHRTMLLSDNIQKTEEYTYAYDAWGRPTETHHTLDNGTAVTLAANAYDAVGRLSSTSRGGSSILPSPNALASNYSYNVRDWLTAIEGSLFTERLSYETNRPGCTLPEQWGGNISSSLWKTSLAPSDSTWYDYGYDPLGRLTEVKYGRSSSPTNFNDRTYAYDLNGNMLSRIRPDSAVNNMNEERENRWTWSHADGNRTDGWNQKLYKKVTLPGVHPWDPPRVTYELDPFGQSEEHYAYDEVGNRTAVLDSQGDTLNVFRYNRLNLPEEYLSEYGDTVRYVYSADGEKLFVQENPVSGVATGTEYAANYRIENGTLTMIHTEAGYYTSTMSNPALGMGPSYKHVWYLKDHLGNNRIVASQTGAVMDVHDYDPFGAEIDALNTASMNNFLFVGANSPYKYGGKEWNETTSTYNFEARQFSPTFHRFTTMDPLAEKYYGISPYAYCANDPINLVDMDGQDSYLIIWVTDDKHYGHAAFAVDNYKQETYIGDNGEEMKRYVPDGTVNIYDLWPRDDGQGGANKTNALQNLPHNYHMKVSLKDLALETDIIGSEGEKPQGVIRFASTFEIDSTAKEKLLEARITKKYYNASTYNCSDYAKIGVNAVSEKEVFGQERILKWTVTTPNALFRDASTSPNAEILRDPGEKVNKRFIPAVLPFL